MLCPASVYAQVKNLCPQDLPVIPLDPATAASNGAGRGGPVRRVLQRLLVYREYLHIQAEVRIAIKALRDAGTTLLVTVDSRTYFTCVLIHAARKLSIPTIVLQWAVVYPGEMLRRMMLRNGKRLEGRLAWAANTMASHVVARSQDGYLSIYSSPENILAQKFAGTLPEYTAWSFAGGNADRVCLWGEAWKDLAVRDGCDPSRLAVTGSPAHDQWHAMKSGAARHHDKYIVLALSCLQFRQSDGFRKGDVPFNEVLESYRSVIDHLLGQKAGKVVVAVHPRDSAEMVRTEIVQSRDVSILPDGVSDEVVAGAICLVCQWSTLAFSAIGLDVPVINLALYDDINNSLYESIDAIRTVHSLHELDSAVEDAILCRDRELARQQSAGRRYLQMDGKCSERILAVMEDLSLP